MYVAPSVYQFVPLSAMNSIVAPTTNEYGALAAPALIVVIPEG